MAKSKLNYWSQRKLDAFTNGEKSALQLAKDLQQNYTLAINEIEKEIQAFYGKFAREHNITLQEAKKLLDKKELKAFNAQLNEYIDYAKNHDINKVYQKELTLLKYKTKISRLEELRAKIKFQLAKLYTKNQNKINKEMLDLYNDSYYKSIFDISQQAGVSISFTEPAIDALKKQLSTEINLGNYSIGVNRYLG